MHGSVQLGGRSPQNLNVPTTTPQLNPATDSPHNSSTSFPSQVKGKKREHGVQGSEPVKQERILRNDDAGCGQLRPELMLKSEIAKITDKGGLVDFEGVEKLVQLMQPVGAVKKIDLASRILLVDVIGVTDKFDCLGRFVQLRGLSVLDEWLQEVHRGKIGDASSPNESDRFVEEFLFVLLRALDKLPVNLHALQTCNIGKSVNHLRTHKNSEIHKKARSLVDTWKKRVEAEMNMLDAKTGSSRGASWSTKSVISVGSRQTGGSSEVGFKSSIIKSSASITLPANLCSDDAVAKFSSGPPCSTKSAASVSTSGFVSIKDMNSVIMTGGGSSDLLTTGEQKSSSSCQSQNNSLSFSSDHGKTGVSCREDARSSTAESMGVNKLSSGSRNRKSSSGLHGSVVSGVENETSFGKLSSLNKNLASEKVLPTRVTSERTLVNNGYSLRLVVRLPNTGRSPARSSSGGSPEDASAQFCKGSPLAHCEKIDHHDQKVKGKGVHCDERSRDSVVGEKLIEASDATCSSSELTLKPKKSYESSFSSINALVESCVKFSEASASASVGDDIGMNLLACVAVGEMSRSDVSPLSSPGRKFPVPEDSCSGNVVKLRQMDEDRARSDYQPTGGMNGGAMEGLGSSVDSLHVKRGFEDNAVPVTTNLSGESKVILLNCEEKTGECITQSNSSSTSSPQNGNGPLLMPDDMVQDASAAISSATEEGTSNDEGAIQFDEMRRPGASVSRKDTISNSKFDVHSPFSVEDMNVGCPDEKTIGNSVVVVPRAGALSAKIKGEAIEESTSCSSLEFHGDDRKPSGSAILMKQKPPIVVCGKTKVTSQPTGSSNDMKSVSNAEKSEKPKLDFFSSNVDHKCGRGQEISGKEVVFGHHPAGSASLEESRAFSKQEIEHCLKSSECKLDGAGSDIAELPPSMVNLSSFSAAGSDMAVKLDFDLNEDLPVDDGSFGELDKVSVPGNSSSAHLLCQLPITVSSMPGSLTASVTVAAAVKGPFVPPENPTRSKAELGWKGSAPISAFRPAEPRKVLEMPLDATRAPPVDKPITKQGRPLLDFDLNVTDQRVLEDVASQNPAPVTCSAFGPCDQRGGRLNLDLNRCDESPEIGQFSASNSCKFEFSKLPGRSLFSGGSSKNESIASRNFDLNDGPSLDEGASETALHAKSGMQFLSYVPGVRMNNMEAGNFSSWFAASNPFSAVAIPPILPGRGGQSYPIVPGAGPQRILSTSTYISPFGPEIYRGPVLSSSPAVAFPPTASFQYPGFPFETNFPLSSNSYSGAPTAFIDSSSAGPLCFPAIPSQLVGLTGMISTPYPQPFVMSLSGTTSNASSESSKWGSLDLNAGPGGTDVDRRDERLPSALRQLLVAGSQGLTGEQLKMYQMAGEVLKRKEPDGGWEGDRINYKRPSWQ